MRSWNIQHRRCRIQGPKTEIEDFAKILSEANIFSLQETKGEIVLQNYKCFNKLRKPATSGGLCIGVHRSLGPGCSAFPIAESQDIQGIKLDKRFFGLRKNLIILDIYRLLQGAAGCDIKELFKTAKDSRPLAIYMANAFKRRKLAKEEPPSPT